MLIKKPFPLILPGFQDKKLFYGRLKNQPFPDQESLCSSDAYDGAVSSRWLENELVLVAPRYNQSHKVRSVAQQSMKT